MSKYVVAYDSLCEQTDRCTCGTDPSGYYGLHEPGCGLVDIAPIALILDLLEAEGRRAIMPEAEPPLFG